MVGEWSALIHVGMIFVLEPSGNEKKNTSEAALKLVKDICTHAEVVFSRFEVVEVPVQCRVLVHSKIGTKC